MASWTVANARSGSRTTKKCVVPATSTARRRFGRGFRRHASTGRVATFDIASKVHDQWKRRRRTIRGTNTRRRSVIQSRPSIGHRPWRSVVCVASHCAIGASSSSAFGSRTRTECPTARRRGQRTAAGITGESGWLFRCRVRREDRSATSRQGFAAAQGGAVPWAPVGLCRAVQAPCCLHRTCMRRASSGDESTRVSGSFVVEGFVGDGVVEDVAALVGERFARAG